MADLEHDTAGQAFDQASLGIGVPEERQTRASRGLQFGVGRWRRRLRLVLGIQLVLAVLLLGPSSLGAAISVGCAILTIPMDGFGGNEYVWMALFSLLIFLILVLVVRILMRQIRRLGAL